ncbi:4-oxalomesaconate hydratase [Staphylococcus microti]|uniref:6-methylsalicylate decarboxylase n=1 Tax=Staphylococcus microti TaxID=569857 RepID=A0A0D6XPA9_9STAP|nr:amidohydrolase family protein [Staphylococcus microti]KIX90265.1 4-oxalomesaconate hydratase [Staphylococcus microti]PNZ82515.1 4-oxalomesaconate hydratase [Staphylococcus microti]SUM57290.1 5-carboxyvanillic acid decarboxylase [Staphylococcus microti]
MTMKIDAFAHVLLPDFYKEMSILDKDLAQKMPFIQNDVLLDMKKRYDTMPDQTKQIISYVNTNPEDYLEKEAAAHLVAKANEELVETVRAYGNIFVGGVAMLAMNNIEEAVRTIEGFVTAHTEILGVQLFTRHLGKSVADDDFRPVFEAAAKADVPIWLHPVFDQRKPDNNIVFSWEYELTQAMLEIVQAGYFKAFPNLKILVHHGGAMVPYFAGRIAHILPKEQVLDFKKFYVDTALLGNAKALELCVDYYGVDHVLFGTDAPLGIMPAGATEVIAEAVNALPLSNEEKAMIFSGNAQKLFGLGDSYGRGF